ncbi:10136_t:CDS:2, partial [Dentiscutata erythropus]
MSSFKWIVISDEYNEDQGDNINEVPVSAINIEVEENATSLLCTKNEPVNLISIFGPASGVDNCDNEIFKTSSVSETVTTGVDISKIFVPLKEFSKFNDNPEIDSNVLVGFVDTEGQGNKGDEFDIYLFSPILVTSTIAIFWWPGLLQVDTILNCLGAMTNSAKRITRDANCQHQNTKPYGHLHIVFRSWNNNNTPEDVKKLLLEPQKIVKRDKDREHNSIRELLSDCFESIDVWLFPKNGLVQDRERLLFEDFNDNWKQTFKNMRKKFSDQLSVNEPKHNAEKPWTGRDIAEFTKLLCKTLTSSERYTITSIFERMQIARAKTLAKNALNDFHALVNKMSPQYKVEGCDDEGIDAYFFEELKNFKEKLKSEGLSDNVVNENYADYHKSVSLIVSEIKTKIAILTVEVQNFRNRFDEYVSTIELPLSKPDLAKSLNELIQQLWNDFNDIIKDFPEGFIQQYREKLENLFEEKGHYIGLSDNAANEIYADYYKSVSLIVSEIKTKIAILTVEVQNFQNRFDESVSIIELPLSKPDLTKSLNELTQQLWSNFNDMVKDFPGGFVQQHREKLENFCKEKSQYIEAENEKRNALKDFQALVNEMNPYYKAEGCDQEGIDAYLYEELKNFNEKLKNNFSDNVVNEIYADYNKTISLIASEIKTKIVTLIIEVQNFQTKFVESISTIALPLSKSDLTKSLKELNQQLLNDFNNMIKDFPNGFVQQHREKLENFVKKKVTLVNEMNPYYKAEGCDQDGIDAYLYEELKNFNEKLKEDFSDNVVNEIYADYNIR